MTGTTPEVARRLLRLAIPNKGSLSQAASDMLREAGYRQRADARQLSLVDTEHGVEFFYLRPRDIALYVGEGTLDLGITGRDLLFDSGAKAEEVLALGFGGSLFRFAAVPGTVTRVEDLAGKRIATSYAGVVRRYLEQRGVEAQVTRLDGAVETSVQLGVADVIADVVETRRHPASGGPRARRRAHLDLRGGARRPGRCRVARGLRGVSTPPRRRPSGPLLRDDGLRHPR